MVSKFTVIKRFLGLSAMSMGMWILITLIYMTFTVIAVDVWNRIAIDIYHLIDGPSRIDTTKVFRYALPIAVVVSIITTILAVKHILAITKEADIKG